MKDYEKTPEFQSVVDTRIAQIGVELDERATSVQPAGKNRIRRLRIERDWLETVSEKYDHPETVCRSRMCVFAAELCRKEIESHTVPQLYRKCDELTSHLGDLDPTLAREVDIILEAVRSADYRVTAISYDAEGVPFVTKRAGQALARYIDDLIKRAHRLVGVVAGGE